MAPEDLEDQIETAEEAGDTVKLFDLISVCTSYGGDDDWMEVAEGSLDAVYRLAKSGKAEVGESTGMSVLFASLAAWKEQDAIVEVALGCIVALSKSYKPTATNGELDLPLLLAILKDFPDESTILEQACLGIEGLALVSDSCKSAFKDMAGIQEELAAAKERITNERNKAYPGRAAEALGLAL